MATSGFHGRSAQTLSGASWQAISFTEVTDTDDYFDAGSPTLITAPALGWYLILGHITSASKSSARDVRVVKNGSTVMTDNQTAQGAVGGSLLGPDFCWFGCLQEGDTLTVEARYATGDTGDADTYASIVRLPSTFFVGDAGAGASGVIDLSTVVDVGGWHDNGTNPSRVTVDQDGNYLFVAVIPGSASADHLASVLVNGATFQAQSHRAAGGTNGYSTVFGIAELAAGDYLEVSSSTGHGTSSFLVLYLSAAPCCMVKQSAAQGITGGGEVVLFDTEEVDTDGFHSTVTNTGRLTVPADAVYLWVGECRLFGFTRSGATVRYNGSSGSPSTYANSPASTTTAGGACVGLLLSATAGDYAEMLAAHDAAGDQNTVPDGMRFSVVSLDGLSPPSIDCSGNPIEPTAGVRQLASAGCGQ